MAHPLATYLERHNLSHAAFAKKIEVGRPAVTKVVNGTRKFSPKVAQRVVLHTRGEVTLEQALSLEPQRRAARRSAA